jgi:hypothetical protein
LESINEHEVYFMREAKCVDDFPRKEASGKERERARARARESNIYIYIHLYIYIYI